MNSDIWNKEEALQRIRGKQSLLNKMLEKFIASTPALLDQLESSIRNDNECETLRHLHTLTGIASSIGANKLSSLSANFKTSFSEISVVEREQHFTEIKDAFAEFHVLAQQHAS